jgi:hypothetical protein
MKNAELAEPVSVDILNHIKLLNTTITDHAKAKHIDNTFAVSTILHTPSLYWHEVDGDMPTPTYLNLKHMVDRINLKIEEFNLLNGIVAALRNRGTKERQKCERLPLQPLEGGKEGSITRNELAS